MPEELRSRRLPHTTGCRNSNAQCSCSVTSKASLTQRSRASLTGQPVRARQELDRGLAAVGGDPYSVRAALDIATWHPPAPAEVTRAFQRHATTRARRRRRIGYGRSRCRNARSRAAIGQRCAPALHRTTTSRCLGVLPHGSNPPRLVGTEPHHRASVGDNHPSRGPAQDRPVLRRGRVQWRHLGSTAAPAPDKGVGLAPAALSTPTASGVVATERCCGGSTQTPPL